MVICNTNQIFLTRGSGSIDMPKVQIPDYWKTEFTQHKCSVNPYLAFGKYALIYAGKNFSKLALAAYQKAERKSSAPPIKTPDIAKPLLITP